MHSETPSPNEPTRKRGRPGRKPIGNKPMTGAERQRRSRAQFYEAGGHYFSIRIEGMHWDHIAAAAQVSGQQPAEVLRDLVTSALDRFVGVTRRGTAMLAAGASQEEVDAFIKRHLYPPLPRISGERSTPTNNE